MTAFLIRPFRPSDTDSVIALWNRCLTRDPITPSRFWHLFLLDENFDDQGALVAEAGDGTIIGFLQAIIRRVPYGSLGTQPDQGWITVFFVDPAFRRQGIGSGLLRAGLTFLRDKGRRHVGCSGYAPYYVFPGVDDEYIEAHAFLLAHGFTVSADAVAMGMALEGVRTPANVQSKRDALTIDGITVRPFERGDTLPLLEFTEAHYPHWTPSIRDSLQRGNTDILVAVSRPASEEREMLAYAQWQNPHNDPPHGAPGRFGPFGVRPDLRSRGIGAVVFYAMIERAVAGGARYLWFGWAGGRNLPFYERAGCHVTRRFQIYKAAL